MIINLNIVQLVDICGCCGNPNEADVRSTHWCNACDDQHERDQTTWNKSMGMWPNEEPYDRYENPFRCGDTFGNGLPDCGLGSIDNSVNEDWDEIPF